MQAILPISKNLTHPATAELGAVGRRPERSYSREPYKSLDHVLDLMKAQINKFKGDSEVRKKAFAITKGIAKDPRTGMADRRDFTAIADQIYNWINKNIAYVRDPDEIEYLQSPLKTIEYGFGDCDDHSILAGALLSSLGVPVQLKVIKANPFEKDLYSHIYLVYQDNGQWKPFDTTLHSKAGHEIADSQIYGQKFIALSGAPNQKKCGCKPQKSMTTMARKSAMLTPVYDINTGKQSDLGWVSEAAAAAGAFASIFANNREEKRAVRDEARNSLWAAGLDRRILSKQHSDQYKQVAQFADWALGEGQPAIDFLNENKTHVLAVGNSIPVSEAKSGYSAWYNQNRQRYEQSSPSTGKVITGMQNFSQAGLNPWLIGGAVLVAGGAIAYSMKN
ncbi:MAG: transglutaminase-like domain-containing protein [Balneolaceae bacterium]